MEIVKMIKLMDGSIHYSKELAIRHLENILAKDLSHPSQEMEHKSAHFIKNYIYENYNKFVQYMQVLEELKQVTELKNF